MVLARFEVNVLSSHCELVEFVLSSTVMTSTSVLAQQVVPLNELEYITLYVDGETCSSLTAMRGVHCLLRALPPTHCLAELNIEENLDIKVPFAVEFANCSASAAL